MDLMHPLFYLPKTIKHLYVIHAWVSWKQMEGCVLRQRDNAFGTIKNAIKMLTMRHALPINLERKQNGDIADIRRKSHPKKFALVLGFLIFGKL